MRRVRVVLAAEVDELVVERTLGFVARPPASIKARLVRR